MKKTKIIAVVMYSIVVVAIIGFLCYQCYTLTNRNIELNNAYKDLETLYTKSEQEVSSLSSNYNNALDRNTSLESEIESVNNTNQTLISKISKLEQELTLVRTDYNKLSEEYQTLSEKAIDQQSADLLQALYLYTWCLNELDFYIDKVDGLMDSTDFYDSMSEVNKELGLQNMKDTIDTVSDAINSGYVYTVTSWIENNYQKYSPEISYDLAILKQHINDAFIKIKYSLQSAYNYYITTLESNKEYFYTSCWDSQWEAKDIFNKAYPICDDLISYCITNIKKSCLN